MQSEKILDFSYLLSRSFYPAISHNFRFNVQNEDATIGNGQKSHKEAKEFCAINGGRLYEPKIFDDSYLSVVAKWVEIYGKEEFIDNSYLSVVAKWVEVQGKEAEGWLGIEGKHKEWVYSESGAKLDR